MTDKYESLWIPYAEFFRHRAWIEEQAEGRQAHLQNHNAISIIVTPEVAERIRGHITRQVEVVGDGPSYATTVEGSCAGCDPIRLEEQEERRAKAPPIPPDASPAAIQLLTERALLEGLNQVTREEAGPPGGAKLALLELTKDEP